MRPIIGLGGGVAEIVDIDLEEPGGCTRPCSLGNVFNVHGVFQGVNGELDVVVNEVLGEVSGRLRDRAEQRWALYPAHLDGGWYHNLTWLALGLWEDIGEVDAVRLLHNEVPEPITDIELGEQDVQAGRRVSHVVQ